MQGKQDDAAFQIWNDGIMLFRMNRFNLERPRNFSPNLFDAVDDLFHWWVYQLTLTINPERKWNQKSNFHQWEICGAPSPRPRCPGWYAACTDRWFRTNGSWPALISILNRTISFMCISGNIMLVKEGIPSPGAWSVRGTWSVSRERGPEQSGNNRSLDLKYCRVPGKV